METNISISAAKEPVSVNAYIAKNEIKKPEVNAAAKSVQLMKEASAKKPVSVMPPKAQDKDDANVNTLHVMKGDAVNAQKKVIREPQVKTEDVVEGIKEKMAREEAKKEVAVEPKTTEFAFNKEIGRMTITIADASTKEVIKEIPPEETQRMLKRIRTMSGEWMDTTV